MTAPADATGPDLPAGQADGAEYLAPYREAVRTLGPRFEALLWRNRAYQIARFDVQADMVDLTGRVVADLGCGFADFAAHLHAGGVLYGRYIGVEAVAELARAARERAFRDGVPECVFLHADFVADDTLMRRLVREHGAEVLAFGGSLNTLEQARAEQVLERAWDAVRDVPGGAAVFNFLSDRAPEAATDADGPARRFDTLRLVEWAMARTPLVAFRQDYLAGHDATIAMRAPG